MRTGFLTGAFAALLAGGVSTTTLMGSPVCNDRTEAEGCFSVNGGKAVFDVSATFAVATHAQSGSLLFADTAAGFELSSSTLVDYSDPDLNVRGFIFALDDDVYEEARVFVTDNGDSGDSILVQLFSGGVVAYEAGGELSDECGGGVLVVSDCSEQPPTEEPPTEEPPCKPGCHNHDHSCKPTPPVCKPGKGPKEEGPCPPEKPEKPGKGPKDKEPKPTRPKGNNGVGNGIDPQPPGNPPINDGPGTGPGNPGNRGGGKKK